MIPSALSKADWTLFSRFEFNSTLEDSLGNSSDLVEVGSGNLTGSTYEFERGDGLLLNTLIAADTYRIEMDVEFSDLSGYNKLIDFENRRPILLILVSTLILITS